MNTKVRQEEGATLAFVAASTIFIVIVGVFAFLMTRLIGASRELKVSTDSGALNVAKQAIQIGVPLSQCSTIAQNNFAVLADPPALSAATAGGAKVDLLTYNRLVAQTMLVGMNAESEGTRDAFDHACLLRLALKDGGSSPYSGINVSAQQAVGNRLYATLMSGASLDSAFTATAGQNSLRMTGDTHQQAQSKNFKVAFVEPNTATNVYWDTTILPPGIAVPPNLFVGGDDPYAKDPQTGKPFMAGYTDSSVMYAPGINGAGAGGLNLRGIPVNPCQQPHLISNEAGFAPRTNPGNLVGTFNPPNAFQEEGAALVGANKNARKQTLEAVSSSVVGVLNKTFEATIPFGYIQLENLPAAPPVYNVAVEYGHTSVFNDELMPPGLYIDVAAGAFTKDPSLYQQWEAHNNGTGPKPQGKAFTIDHINAFVSTSGSTIYGDYHKIKTDARLLNWEDIHAFMRDQRFIDDIITVFTKAGVGRLESFSNSTAVEFAKEHFVKKIESNMKKNASGHMIPDDKMFFEIPNGPDGGPMTTGMKLALPNDANGDANKTDYTEHYTAPSQSGNYKFEFGNNNGSMTPTASNLINQIESAKGGSNRTPASSAIQYAILQRAREIVPSTTLQDIQNILNTAQLGMGSKVYIYADNPTSSNPKLSVHTSLPPWASDLGPNGAPVPDGSGSRQELSFSTRYAIVGNMIDAYTKDTSNMSSNAPHKDGDAHYHKVPFKEVNGKDVRHVPREFFATDNVKWTPSTGFDNFLGRLQFFQQAQGRGVFTTPN